MKLPIHVFVDSDVIVSSLLSSKGAAHLLLFNKQNDIIFFVSNYSLAELKTVALRLQIEHKDLDEVVRNYLNQIQIRGPLKTLQKTYKVYVSDPYDAHIIAGAKKASAKFLLSYNLRHYKPEKIKQDFNIILLTPAMLLQYLRSR